MIGGLSFLDKEGRNQLMYFFWREKKQGRFATLFEIYETLLTQSNPCHFG